VWVNKNADDNSSLAPKVIIQLHYHPETLTQNPIAGNRNIRWQDILEMCGVSRIV
jgi:hypothetical protein